MKLKDKYILEHIKEYKGITINKNKKIMEYKDGYQVSKKDCFVISLDDDKLLIDCINKTIQQANKGDDIGVWIDDNKYYVDISENIKNKKIALKKGIKQNQIAIWDFMNNTNIYCKDKN